MNLAGALGPFVAWRQRYPAPPPGASYLDTLALSVQAVRPDGANGPTWTTAGPANVLITFTERTATTLYAQHIFRSDVAELPWIDMPRTRSDELADLPQHWTFLHTLTVNGYWIPIEPTCLNIYFDRRCRPDYSLT